MINRIGKKEHPKVVDTLRRLDITAQLETVELLVQQLRNLDVGKKQDGSVLQICVDNVHQGIKSMHAILQIIESMMEEHNEKW